MFDGLELGVAGLLGGGGGGGGGCVGVVDFDEVVVWLCVWVLVEVWDV